MILRPSFSSATFCSRCFDFAVWTSQREKALWITASFVKHGWSNTSCTPSSLAVRQYRSLVTNTVFLGGLWKVLIMGVPYRSCWWIKRQRLWSCSKMCLANDCSVTFSPNNPMTGAGCSQLRYTLLCSPLFAVPSVKLISLTKLWENMEQVIMHLQMKTIFRTFSFTFLSSRAILWYIWLDLFLQCLNQQFYPC